MMPLNPVFLWVFLPSGRSGEAPAMIWFLFEVFLLLERWPSKVVETPLPGSGTAIQHLLHPADALSCPLSLSLAAVASCWCCWLVDISVLPPRQPGLFCQSVSGCRHLHPEKFLYDLLRHSSRWDFSCPHPPASPLGHTDSPLQIQCWGLTVTVPNNTCHHEKALHRTCCG